MTADATPLDTALSTRDLDQVTALLAAAPDSLRLDHTWVAVHHLVATTVAGWGEYGTRFARTRPHYDTATPLTQGQRVGERLDTGWPVVGARHALWWLLVALQDPAPGTVPAWQAVATSPLPVVRIAGARRRDVPGAVARAWWPAESVPDIRAHLCASLPLSDGEADSWVDAVSAAAEGQRAGEAPPGVTLCGPTSPGGGTEDGRAAGGAPGPLALPLDVVMAALATRATLSLAQRARLLRVLPSRHHHLLLDDPGAPQIATAALLDGAGPHWSSASTRQELLTVALGGWPYTFREPTVSAASADGLGNRQASRRALMALAAEVPADLLAGALGWLPDLGTDEQAQLLAVLPRAGRVLLLRHLGRVAGGTEPPRARVTR